ncbi:MAG: hypothetical protein HY555_00065 [Euryarchaeota archaeon]|nr:hypothetical protein [Euryarchaeota archaeon]
MPAIERAKTKEEAEMEELLEVRRDNIANLERMVYACIFQVDARLDPPPGDLEITFCVGNFSIFELELKALRGDVTVNGGAAGGFLDEKGYRLPRQSISLVKTACTLRLGDREVLLQDRFLKVGVAMRGTFVGPRTVERSGSLGYTFFL